MKIKNRHRGLGTIELVIAAGLALAIAAGVAKLLSVTNKSAKIATARAEFITLADMVGVALRDPATCANALVNSSGTIGFFNPLLSILPTAQVSEIRLGGNTLAKKNAAVGGLQVTDISLTEEDVTKRVLVPLISGRYYTKLTVTATPLGITIPKPLERSYILYVNTTLALGANLSRITSCELQTMSPVTSAPSGGGGGYSIIARHSLTTTAPSCPSGWDSLWQGYSFAGGGTDSSGWSIDLGTSGSCLETFNPLPYLVCANSGNTCDYSWNTELTLWLSTASVDELPVTGIAAMLPKISRCNVCAKASPVLVRHNIPMTTTSPPASPTTPPACPTGWSSLWTGYSLGGMSVQNSTRTNYLHSPGSCLEQFKPNPFIECNTAGLSEKCDYWTLGDKITWLTGYFSPTPLFNRSGMAPGGELHSLIGRCTVCAPN